MKYRIVANRHHAGWFHVVRDPEESELVAAALLNEPRPPYVVVLHDIPWREAQLFKEKLKCQTSTGQSDGPSSA